MSFDEANDAYGAYESNYRSMMGFADDDYESKYILDWNYNEESEGIIDSFLDESDGNEWSIWNRFIDGDDEDGLAQNIVSEWTKGDEGNIFDFNNVFSTTTEANNEIKRRCMILFGQPLCLCEFMNGLADPDGRKPLYECDTSPFLGSESSKTEEGKKGKKEKKEPDSSREKKQSVKVKEKKEEKEKKSESSEDDKKSDSASSESKESEDEKDAKPDKVENQKRYHQHNRKKNNQRRVRIRVMTMRVRAKMKM